MHASTNESNKCRRLLQHSVSLSSPHFSLRGLCIQLFHGLPRYVIVARSRHMIYSQRHVCCVCVCMLCSLLLLLLQRPYFLSQISIFMERFLFVVRLYTCQLKYWHALRNPATRTIHSCYRHISHDFAAFCCIFCFGLGLRNGACKCPIFSIGIWVVTIWPVEGRLITASYYRSSIYIYNSLLGCAQSSSYSRIRKGGSMRKVQERLKTLDGKKMCLYRPSMELEQHACRQNGAATCNR